MIPEQLQFIEKEKIVVVDPSIDLQDRLSDLLLQEGVDFSMNVVIYPGRRPSHYLRKRIAEKVKKTFIPPKIYSMDDFILHIHGKIFNAKPIDSLDGVFLIHSILRRLNLLKEAFLEIDSFFSIGERLFNVIEELYIERIRPEKIKEVEFLIDIPSKSMENLNLLSSLYEAFYKEIDMRGLATRSKRYVCCADYEELDRVLDCERIIFAGFFAFTEAERRILKTLSKNKGFVLVYQKEGEITEEGRKIHFYSAPDIHGEVKIVGDILKKKGIDSNTAIVLPRSDTLFPLIRHGISFIDEGMYNISAGYPLWRTPIFGFFLNLFEVIETMRDSKIYVPSYLKFILHPYTKNIELMGSSESGRIVLHGLQRVLKDDIPLTFADISWIEEDLPSHIANLVSTSGFSETEIKRHIEDIHTTFLRPFFQIRNVKDFFEKCSSILRFIYDKSTAKYHPLFYPYVEGYLKEFSRISSSLLGEYVFERIISYFNLFSRVLSSSFFPFEGDPKKGLQVLGFLETRNLRFEKVIFLDVNEGVIPDLTEDYFLPYKVRKILGLPTYKEREDLTFHYFNTLLCGAREVHVLFLENEESVKSRFLERIIWEMEKRKGSVIGERSLRKALNYRVSLTNFLPQPVEKTERIMEALENISFSPSALDDYLKCGIKFYLRYVLKIGEERKVEEMDRQEIGNIVHSVLKRFFKGRLRVLLIPKGTWSDEVSDIIDEIFSLRYGHLLDGKAYLIKRQVEKRIREFIDYLRNVAKIDRIRILSSEEQVEVQYLGSNFSFRVDLVQERNGKIELLDFKTSGREDTYLFKRGTSEVFGRGDYHKLPSLQMPLYILLYAKRYEKELKDVSGFYFFLGQKVLNQESLLSPFSDISMEDGMGLVSKIVESLIREIKDPSIPFSCRVDPLEVCEFCPYKSICGTRWVSLRNDH